MDEGIEVIIKKDGEEIARDYGDFCIVQVVQNNGYEAHVHGECVLGAEGVFNALGSLVADMCLKASEGGFE